MGCAVCDMCFSKSDMATIKPEIDLLIPDSGGSQATFYWASFNSFYEQYTNFSIFVVSNTSQLSVNSDTNSPGLHNFQAPVLSHIQELFLRLLYPDHQFPSQIHAFRVHRAWLSRFCSSVCRLGRSNASDTGTKCIDVCWLDWHI